MAKKLTSEKVYIGNKEITLKPINFEQMTAVMFLLVPYVKLIKTIKDELGNTKTDVSLFYDIINNLIEQLDKTSLIRILSIFLGESPEYVTGLTASDIMPILPNIIYINDLYIVYSMFKQLEAFE